MFRADDVGTGQHSVDSGYSTWQVWRVVNNIMIAFVFLACRLTLQYENTMHINLDQNGVLRTKWKGNRAPMASAASKPLRTHASSKGKPAEA